MRIAERSSHNQTLPRDVSRRNAAAMAARVSACWEPAPLLTVSQHAERYRILSREASAEHGPWRNDRTPYLVEIMDAFTDPLVERIDVVAASQLGKTEVLLNIIHYIIDVDPGPILVLEPTLSLARTLSRDRITQMIRDSLALKGKVAEEKSRSKARTMFHYEFPGGIMTIATANSASELAMRPIRYLITDECDDYPANVDNEGSPLDLALKRTTRFRNRKIVNVSSPRVLETSVIWPAYQDGTQEQWCFGCPECGEYQPAVFEQLLENGMICRVCGVPSPAHLWHRAAHWQAQYPERRRERRRRSFHLPIALLPWLSVPELCREEREARAGGAEKLQVFTNTRLALPWEEPAEKLDAETITTHHYNADVPRNVLLLTAGVDVQANRLELEIVGWGKDFESWGIRYYVIPGDPHQPSTWAALDRVLQQTYRREDGVMLPIVRTGVDSGYATNHVYAYTQPRQARGIYAVRGASTPGRAAVLPVTRQGKLKNVFVFPVTGDVIKNTLHANLLLKEEGPGYCHFPRETEFADGTPRGYTSTYFYGLTAEKRVRHRVGGVETYTWQKKFDSIRNEPLDCRVYAHAALLILNPNWDELIAAQTPAPPAPTPRRKLSANITPGY